ncbi:hypothetical protein [Paraburkholderia antibiotica]|uniref:Uncharacterized protein n=1 Tax=Paraburkholderia antibiotica TaxID=2728839 RepID=A0A7Y0A1V4_9BURK|nr:hypothetical protein [Paraburkholderia antibiotica]NML34929.1 hypothetical protein [Paraburkholderia antibiotica]
MSAANWVDHELRNWARWANSGPSPHPRLPGSFLGTWVISELHVDSAADDRPAPIHEENAMRVQRVFDVAIRIERKVLQAEYLSPWQYSRHSGGVAAAARKLELTTPAYETILASVKRRVERAFQ